ncbi:hypothetical protein [Companilactobacillus kimchiensis]|uniref:YfhO family protein n=1 Tax=Companilactobacillus kimchiensis TaxID=993692 RepID=A0A0R2LDH6_9LACO|nr:hypothetical protein [Companilactobacillus kimchiensis]KRN99944.1 hypothetical protein IV57_GL002277 [Companilactobacillus kimchiensis]
MKKIFVQHKLLLTTLLFLFTSIISIYLTGLDGHIWSFLTLSNDGRFHVMRMEGLYDSIKQGVFFPVVNMSFLDGFGYISNIFYSNLWLYPAAFLRLAGLSVFQSFVMYYVLLNFCTFSISFWAYYQVSHRYNQSLFFSFLYTLSTYRIFDLVRRFDVGEILTMVFLPIVILGVYEIFYADQKKWVYLALGMVAVIYSHALSPVLIAIFIGLVVILRIANLIKEPQRIVALVNAILVSLVLSLAYFLPMIEQLRHTQFKLTYAPLINVSQTGLSWQNLFNWSMNNDLYNGNIGLVMLITAGLIPLTIWKVKNKAVRDFAIIGELLLFMTTDIFPWKYFDKTPVNMIQFPWRFDMIVSILFAIFLTYDALDWFKADWKKIGLIFIILGITLGSEQALIKNHPREEDSYAEFNRLDVYSIGSGEEYLPKNADLDILYKATHKPQVKNGTAKLSDFKQRGSQISFDFQNAKSAQVDVPIIGYYGYSAKKSKGQVSRLTMDQKNNGLGQVTINGTGTVQINYYPTFIQKISKIISLVGLIILSFIFLLKKLKK